MNKIVQINLGGIAFTIDEDAYQVLLLYIERLKAHFNKSGSAADIIADIEARLGELLIEKKGAAAIISKANIEEVIGIMGSPADFGIDMEEGEAASEEAQSTTTYTAEPGTKGKRLYRDPDEAVFGGVCAGLSAYFGISDPVWLRIAFSLAMILGFGAPILLYFALMFIVPEADTAAQKLQMKGVPVTIENLAKQAEQKAKSFASDLEAAANKLRHRGMRKVFRSTFGETAGTFLEYCVKAVVIFMCGTLLLSMGSVWISIVVAYVTHFNDFNQHLFTSTGMTWLSVLLILLALGIPMIWVVFFIFRVFYRYRPHVYFRGTLFGLWVVSLISLGVIGGMVANEFNSNYTTRKPISLSGVTSDSLIIERTGDAINEGSVIQFGPIHWESNELMSSHIDIHVKQTDEKQYYAEMKLSAQGKTSAMAIQNVAAIQFNPTVQGNKLIIPMMFSLEANQKWRYQHVDITIFVPIGKCIIMSPDYEEDGERIHIDYADDIYVDGVTGRKRVLKMTNKGVRCLNCPAEER